MMPGRVLALADAPPAILSQLSSNLKVAVQSLRQLYRAVHDLRFVLRTRTVHTVATGTALTYALADRSLAEGEDGAKEQLYHHRV